MLADIAQLGRKSISGWRQSATNRTERVRRRGYMHDRGIKQHRYGNNLQLFCENEDSCGRIACRQVSAIEWLTGWKCLLDSGRSSSESRCFTNCSTFDVACIVTIAASGNDTS
jgi:hypothetical protein